MLNFKINYQTKIRIFSLIHKFFYLFNLQLYYSKKTIFPKNLRLNEIIDVGVAYGTDFLIQNYPRAKYHLIEPNKKFWPFIEKELLKKIKGKLYKIGADEKKRRVKLYLLDVSSSFIKRENLKKKHPFEYIETSKLDLIFKNKKFKKKSLLKIDTEGYELKVLKGSIQVLKKIDYLILEVRINNVKTYNPSELISFCYKNNFIWKDILKVYYLKNGISYFDILFEKKILK